MLKLQILGNDLPIGGVRLGAALLCIAETIKNSGSLVEDRQHQSHD